MKASTTLSLSIQESQGFQLPSTLSADEPELEIKSGVKISIRHLY